MNNVMQRKAIKHEYIERITTVEKELYKRMYNHIKENMKYKNISINEAVKRIDKNN